MLWHKFITYNTSQIYDNIKNLPEPEKNSLGAGIPRRLLNQIVPKDPILERNFIEF